MSEMAGDGRTAPVLLPLARQCESAIDSLFTDRNAHYDWMDLFLDRIMNTSLSAADQLKTPRRRAALGANILFSAQKTSSQPETSANPAARLFGSAARPTASTAQQRQQHKVNSPGPAKTTASASRDAFGSPMRGVSRPQAGVRSPMALSPQPRTAGGSPSPGRRMVVDSPPASPSQHRSPPQKPAQSIQEVVMTEVAIESEAESPAEEVQQIAEVEGEDAEMTEEKTANLSIIGEEEEEEPDVDVADLLDDTSALPPALAAPRSTIPLSPVVKEPPTPAEEAVIVQTAEVAHKVSPKRIVLSPARSPAPKATSTLSSAPNTTTLQAAPAVATSAIAPLSPSPVKSPSIEAFSVSKSSSIILQETQFAFSSRQEGPAAATASTLSSQSSREHHHHALHPEADETVPLNDAPSTLRSALSSSQGLSQSASKPARAQLNFVGLPKKSLPFALRASSSFVIGDSQQSGSSQDKDRTGSASHKASAGPRGSVAGNDDSGAQRRAALAQRLQSLGVKNGGRASAITTSSIALQHATTTGPAARSSIARPPLSPPPSFSTTFTALPHSQHQPTRVERPLSPPPLPLPPSMSTAQLPASQPPSTASAVPPAAVPVAAPELARRPSVRESVRNFEVRAASPVPSSSSKFRPPPLSPHARSGLGQGPRSPIKSWFAAGASAFARAPMPEEREARDEERRALPHLAVAPIGTTSSQVAPAPTSPRPMSPTPGAQRKVERLPPSQVAAASTSKLPSPIKSGPSTPGRSTARPMSPVAKGSTTPIDSPPPPTPRAIPTPRTIVAPVHAVPYAPSPPPPPPVPVTITQAPPQILMPAPVVAPSTTITSASVDVESDDEEDDEEEMRAVGDMLGLPETSLRFGDEDDGDSASSAGDDEADPPGAEMAVDIDSDVENESIVPSRSAAPAVVAEERRKVDEFAMQVDDALRTTIKHGAVSQGLGVSLGASTSATALGRSMPGAFLGDANDEDDDESETRSTASRTLSKQSSTASLASAAAGQPGGGSMLGGLFKFGASSSQGGAQKKIDGKGGVKSIQLAAAAARKEKEEKERRAALKEEREQKRVAALNRRQDEERQKLDEDRRAVEKKRKEREEHTGPISKPAPTQKVFKPSQVSKPGKTERSADDEPAKKRKVEPEPAPAVKKVPTISRPLTASTSTSNLHASLNASTNRPAPTGSTLNKSASASTSAHLKVSTSSTVSAASLVGVKFMNVPGVSNASSTSGMPARVAALNPQATSSSSHLKSSHLGQSQSSRAPPPPPIVEPEEPIVLPDIDSEYSDSSDEAHEEKIKHYPSWAKSPSTHLLMQQHTNPDDVFGPIPPLRMKEIFKTNHERFTKRSSSARWEGGDALTKAEKEKYSRTMGYVSTTTTTSSVAQQQSSSSRASTSR